VTKVVRSPRRPKGEPLGLYRTPREGWRRASNYGCKYAQKDWSGEHVGRDKHRYEVVRGFSPVNEASWVSDRAEAERRVNGLVTPEGRGHLKVWDSSDQAGWSRPPVKTWRW
jgi:hypothetical protein